MTPALAMLLLLASMTDNAGSGCPPSFRDAGAGSLAAAPSWRSFGVEAYAGRKIAGWPLGRLDIAPEGLRVRLLFPWFMTRSAARDMITVVSVTRTVAGVCCVRFEDCGQCLADVHVHLPVRAQRIINELRRCGYVVVDRKTGEPVAGVPKRWRAA